MDYRHALVVIAFSLGLGGCASYPSNYRSDLRYEDGSYYSPVDAGYGDYYYAPEPRHGYHDYYDQSFFYGSPFHSFGGYCSARYRYCPPFGYSPFLDPYHRFGFSMSYSGNGWYDPFWARYGYPSPYYGHRPRRGHTPDDRSADQRRPAMDEDGAEVTETAALPRTRQRWRDSEPMRSRPEPQPREFPVPEPQRRRSESSAAPDDDSGPRRHTSRRGDDRRDPRRE